MSIFLNTAIEEHELELLLIAVAHMKKRHQRIAAQAARNARPDRPTPPGKLKHLKIAFQYGELQSILPALPPTYKPIYEQ